MYSSELVRRPDFTVFGQRRFAMLLRQEWEFGLRTTNIAQS
jgi:hypothetical protein